MGNIPATVIMRGNISHVNRICEKINKMRFLTGFIDKNQSPGNHCYLFSAINSATASNTGDSVLALGCIYRAVISLTE